MTFKCCLAFSLHRAGKIILEPLLPTWFTTYLPRKPVAPKTVLVMPLRVGSGRKTTRGVSESRFDRALKNARGCLENRQTGRRERVERGGFLKKRD
jgi:hypothetical protein